MGHKAIAIPVVMQHGKPPRYCLVRDRRFRDWTFVTGGCRKREIENPIRCALRELCEETRGAIRLFEGQYMSYSFNIKLDDSPELHTYNVFIFLVDFNSVQKECIVSSFDDHKRKTEERKRQGMSIRLVQDENDILTWTSLDNILTNFKLWEVADVVANSDIIKRINSGDENLPWLRFGRDVVYGDKV